MKEKIKMIVVFGLGILVSSGVIYAATLYSATEVSYDNTSSGSRMTNVQGALDELYEKANFSYVGTAQPEDVLEGKTFYNNSNILQTGTLKTEESKRIYLYHNGDQALGLTGGWDKYHTTANVANYYRFYKGSLNDNHILLKVDGSLMVSSLISNDKIDLTPYNKFAISYKIVEQSGTMFFSLGAGNSSSNFDNVKIRKSVPTGSIEVILDISTLEDSYYIITELYTLESYGSGTIQVYSIWVE